jgi:hypothetical protein
LPHGALSRSCLARAVCLGACVVQSSKLEERVPKTQPRVILNPRDLLLGCPSAFGLRALVCPTVNG